MLFNTSPGIPACDGMVNIAWGVVLVTHLLIKWVKATFEYLDGFPDYRVIVGDQQVGGYFWIPLSINVGFGGSTRSFLGEDDWM